MTIRALPWVGGKHPHGVHGKVSRSVARMLPSLPGYAEPCAGMLGVLLHRPRARLEIANDADFLVVNWWRCGREDPDRMISLTDFTPHAREEVRRANEMLVDYRAQPEPPPEPDFDLAWAFQTSLLYGFGETAGGVVGFRLFLEPRAGNRQVPDFLALADRLRGVQLETKDCADILAQLADRDDYAIYFDPPYEGTAAPYGAALVDRGRIADLLRKQRGPVAISGYGEEWDGLGWRRREYGNHHVNPQGKVGGRVEVVWTNFDPPAGLF